MFVSGLGAYNSANARHSVAQLKDVHLFATKASWSTWQRLSIRSDKFQCLFWILKMSAACVGNFRRTTLVARGERNLYYVRYRLDT